MGKIINTPSLAITTIILIFTAAISVSTTEPKMSLPTEHDIMSLSEMSNLTINAFRQETILQRMLYFYNKGFINNKTRDQLNHLAQRAIKDLVEIQKNQQQLKSQIEHYPGDDWDQRYGITGLWKQISYDIHKTQVRLLEVSYYRSLCKTSPPSEKTFGEQFNEWPLFIKIRNYQNKSKKDINELAEKIVESKCKIEPELTAVFFSLTKQFKNERALKEIFKACPQIQSLFSEVILLTVEQLTTSKKLVELTVTEAQIAVIAAAREKAENNADLFVRLLKEKKFQTPLIFYITADSLKEKQPLKAIQYLIHASQLQTNENADLFHAAPHDIAALAAKIGYDLYLADADGYDLTIDAFENYFAIAQENADPQLKYLYADILYQGGEQQKGLALLKKIADDSSHPYKKSAAVNLAAIKLSKRTSGSNFQIDEEDTAQYLVSAISTDNIPGKDSLLVFLSYCLENIEQITTDVQDRENFLRNCKQLAQYVHQKTNSASAVFYLAEITSLFKITSRDELLKIKIMLDGMNIEKPPVEYLRAKARVETALTHYQQAVMYWFKITEILPEPSPNGTGSYRWWRAKYFQLYCLSKIPGSKKNIVHTIDVFENSYRDIDEPWRTKLRKLKKIVTTTDN